MPTRLVIGVVAVVVLMGCAGDDPPDSHPPPTTTAPSTTLSQERADELALRQLAEDWYETIDRIVIDGAEPTVATEYLTGDYLDAFLADANAYRRSGRTAERSLTSREVIESIAVEDAEAIVETCVVDGDTLRDQAGAVLDDAVWTSRYALGARRSADGWRFHTLDELGEREEGDACDA